LLDLILLGVCRLLATRLEPTTGRTRTCRCRWFGLKKLEYRLHEAQAQFQERHDIGRSCMSIWKGTIDDFSKSTWILWSIPRCPRQGSNNNATTFVAL
jgi:hypothetical protein